MFISQNARNGNDEIMEAKGRRYAALRLPFSDVAAASKDQIGGFHWG